MNILQKTNKNNVNKILSKIFLKLFNGLHNFTYSIFVNLFGRSYYKMLERFNTLNAIIKDIDEKLNGKLNGIVKNYLYLYIEDTLDPDYEQTLKQNILNSSVIVINNYKDKSMENDKLHFIIVFRKTVLIIKQSLLQNLHPLFQEKGELEICFFEDTKSIFDESINIDYKESTKSKNFNDEISKISNEFFKSIQFQDDDFLDKIKSCISGYLIQQSYCNLNYDRVKDFYSESKKEIIPI